MSDTDVLVLGAGAAGLFCAGVAAQRGASVVVLDHREPIAEKIRISGGGRCNFTNLEGDRIDRYLGEQPGFARGVLRGYRPKDFIALVRRYRIGFHEKHRGQLFGDESSERIIAMLRAEAQTGGVRWLVPVTVDGWRALESGSPGAMRFAVQTSAGEWRCRSLVVATGGLSIPPLGATDLGYRIARSFGHRIVEPRPALVPLTVQAEAWRAFSGLSGVSLPVRIRVSGRSDAPRFDEDLLFTHRGLSGPAALQISSYWRPGEALAIDLAPDDETQGDLLAVLRSRREQSRQQLGNVLAERLPRRLVTQWLEAADPTGPRPAATARLAELGNRELQRLVDGLRGWSVSPSGTEGFRKAEVTVGGVATEDLEARSLQSRRQPGLHFAGEVVDITGWLGGYNFQWAWSSGFAVGCAVSA